MEIVKSILPALSADSVLEKAVGQFQSVVICGYNDDGVFQARASRNLRSHEILWLLETFKHKLITGEFAKD